MTLNRIYKWAAAGMLAAGAIPAVGLAAHRPLQAAPSLMATGTADSVTSTPAAAAGAPAQVAAAKTKHRTLHHRRVSHSSLHSKRVAHSNLRVKHSSRTNLHHSKRSHKNLHSAHKKAVAQ